MSFQTHSPVGYPGTSAANRILPTGDDSGGGDAAALNAAIARGGPVYVEPGIYTFSQTFNVPAVPTYIYGSGAESTVFRFIGSGDFLRVTSPVLFAGGGIRDLTIDGSASAPGSTGIHMGDISFYNLQDVIVKNFTGAGAIGFHFDNAYNWTERLHGRIFAENCASHVVYDVSTSTSTSFMRQLMDIFILQGDPTQDGVVFRNGAGTSHSKIYLGGNFQASAAALTSAVLRITGSLGGANSGISYSDVRIGVECNGAAGNGPITIAQGSAANQLLHCSGGMNFSAAPQPFTSAGVNPTSYFAGYIIGDAALGSGGFYGDSFTATNLLSAAFKVQTPEIVSSLTGGGRIFSGSGAPVTPNSQNPVAGDIYFRTDTPATANQRIYICTVGGATPTWAGIV